MGEPVLVPTAVAFRWPRKPERPAAAAEHRTRLSRAVFRKFASAEPSQCPSMIEGSMTRALATVLSFKRALLAFCLRPRVNLRIHRLRYAKAGVPCIWARWRVSRWRHSCRRAGQSPSAHSPCFTPLASALAEEALPHPVSFYLETVIGSPTQGVRPRKNAYLLSVFRSHRNLGAFSWLRGFGPDLARLYVILAGLAQLANLNRQV